MATLADVLRGYTPPTESALADPIIEHFRTLPQQLEANQRAMDKTMAGMYKTDFLGKPNPNYYPEAMGEFTQSMPNFAGTFIGPSSKLWNQVEAFKAAKMLKEGVDPKEVWKLTGTGRGLDNQFRQEISDLPMKFNEPEIDKFRRMRNAYEAKDMSKSRMNLYDLATHDPFRYAYPESPETLVFRGMSQDGGGSTSPLAWDAITLNVEPANYWMPKKDSIADMRSTLLHELQHNVQAEEGFAKGGNPQMFKDITPNKAQQKRLDKLKAEYEKYEGGTPERFKAVQDYFDYERQFNPSGQYHNLAGEAEARTTSRRADLDEAARREHYPFERSRYGLDINPDDALLLMEHNQPIVTRREMLQKLIKKDK